MGILNKITAVSLTGFLVLSAAAPAYGQSNEEKLNSKAASINEMNKEKSELENNMAEIKNELAALEKDVQENKAKLASIEEEIEKTKKEIEKKKEEIIVLQEKVHKRKEVMEQRIVALQHTNQTDLIIEVLLNSENISDFIQRATAASTILNADKSLFEQQEQDLLKIEEEKAEIDRQEQKLNEQFESLAKSQEALHNKLNEKQNLLASTEEKYKTIQQQISLAEKEKKAIEQEIEKAKEALAREKESANKRAKSYAAASPVQKQTGSKSSANKQNRKGNAPAKSSNQKEFYVTATAYSHEDSKTGRTATGINIKANPNMKLIAVDPSVIPLGSRVWVEGYGEALAADTGGAIKGYKIDVLMPSNKHALQWGRRTVKVIVLN